MPRITENDTAVNIPQTRTLIFEAATIFTGTGGFTSPAISEPAMRFSPGPDRTTPSEIPMAPIIMTRIGVDALEQITPWVSASLPAASALND